jgi:uroporphyrinogen-III synthase
MKYWNINSMRDRRFTILSTASMPLEKIPPLPESVEIRMVPFIEILARQDEETKSRITELAKEKHTVIFTSVQAVRAVTACLQHKPDWKMYCVGTETRSSIGNWFGPNAIQHSAENAQALSEIIIGDHIKEAIFFCGDQRMDILPEKLKNRGIRLTELIVYETRLTPIRLEKPPDAVLFFSPTAVRSFFSMNSISPATPVFAMGKTTAATLKQYTGNPVIISSEADKAFVLNLALEYAGSHPII